MSVTKATLPEEPIDQFLHQYITEATPAPYKKTPSLDFAPTPQRLIEFPNSSENLQIQDKHDTLNDLQQNFFSSDLQQTASSTTSHNSIHSQPNLDLMKNKNQPLLQDFFNSETALELLKLLASESSPNTCISADTPYSSQKFFSEDKNKFKKNDFAILPSYPDCGDNKNCIKDPIWDFYDKTSRSDDCGKTYHENLAAIGALLKSFYNSKSNTIDQDNVLTHQPDNSTKHNSHDALLTAAFTNLSQKNTQANEFILSQKNLFQGKIPQSNDSSIATTTSNPSPAHQNPNSVALSKNTINYDCMAKLTNSISNFQKLPQAGVNHAPQSENLMSDQKNTMNNSNLDSDLSFFLPDNSLNLKLFKIFPCRIEALAHDRKNCPFYHSQRDRRRYPSIYSAEQCEEQFDYDDDYACACRRGDTCNKCHNRHELLYHPYIYKQRFCSSYNPSLDRSLQCHRRQFCAFAHNRSEIRSQLFSELSERKPSAMFFIMEFKTYWCPYGTQHDWHGCLYAHTYQDCRRTPLIGYGSEPCPYWQKDLHSVDYRKRCIHGTHCAYSHGSKEQLYHPAYYKTMPCTDYKIKQTCPRGKLCAFYHDIAEKRSITIGTTPGDTLKPVYDGTNNVNRFNVQVLCDPLSQNIYQYDYSQRLSSSAMSKLQKNFMCLPLFNLDDFEAFGRASRSDCGRNRSMSSMSGTYFKNYKINKGQIAPFMVQQYRAKEFSPPPPPPLQQ